VVDSRDKYRFDDRTEDQFKREIKAGNYIERSLFKRWLATIGNPPHRETGCGMNGEFLEFDKVSTEPDFFVEGIGAVEVKFCRPVPQEFHLKISQIEQYIQQNAQLLMVLGAGLENPKYTLISVDDLKFLLAACDHVVCRQFGNKKAIRVPADWIQWKRLP
jgi:hypothetical protein